MVVVKANLKTSSMRRREGKDDVYKTSRVDLSAAVDVSQEGTGIRVDYKLHTSIFPPRNLPSDKYF